jgi:hypothetical protein
MHVRVAEADGAERKRRLVLRLLLDDQLDRLARSRFMSVMDIEPESSTMASTFESGVHAAA